jgi:hypothetical protein
MAYTLLDVYGDSILMAYAEIFAEFPQELRLPIARLVDTLRDEFAVGRTDFEELKAIVRELVQAQARTEMRLEALAQAQQRTDDSMEALRGIVRGLAEAQQLTELRVQELTQAQQRTELRLVELAGTVQKLAEEHRLFRYSFDSKLGGLGARWGMQTEEAFRQGMREILREVGFTAERFLEYDAAGEVFGHPDQVELDVVIQNGKVIVVEIKSSLDQANIYLFDRKVAFYARKTGRQVDRKVVVTPFVDNRAKDIGLRLGVEIFTDVRALS